MKCSLVSHPPGPELQFFEKLAAGDFCLQRCEECDGAVFYPRVVCPHCGGDALHWVSASGRGTVYATTVLYDKAAGDYNVSLIELAEGPRLMSQVVAVPAREVRIGQAVRARLMAAQAQPLLVFEPCEEQA